MLKSIKNFKKRRKDCKKKQRKKFKKRGGREGAYSEIIRNVVKFFLGFLCKPKASSFYASNFNQSFLHFQFSLSLTKIKRGRGPSWNEISLCREACLQELWNFGGVALLRLWAFVLTLQLEAKSSATTNRDNCGHSIEIRIETNIRKCRVLESGAHLTSPNVIWMQLFLLPQCRVRVICHFFL